MGIVRYVFTFMLFFGILIVFACRINMSVGIVAMTDVKQKQNGKVFEWSSFIRQCILSSFFLGYTLIQVPAGYWSKKYGCKIPIFIGALASGILTILLPLCAKLGDWPWIVANRILQGFIQGLIFPSVHTFLSKWAPIKERSTMGIIIYSGVFLGSFAMSTCSGYIVTHFGWPWIFYLSGSLAVVWSIVWLIFGGSYPSTNRWVSEDEKIMIEESLGVQNTAKEYIPIPWSYILTSRPFLALVASWGLYSWGFIILLVEIPLYLANYYGVDIRENGVLSGLPFLLMFFMNFVYATIEYFVVQKYEIISIQVGRKLFNSIGMFGLGISYFILSFFNKDQVYFAIVVLCLGVSAASAVGIGTALNHIDLSPNNAGILIAITNTLGTIVYTCTPICFAFIVTDGNEQNQWRTAYVLSSIILAVAGTIFLVFGSAKEQPWNNLGVAAEAKPA